MTPNELIGSAHGIIATLHYSLVNTKKYSCGYMDEHTITKTFSEDFQEFRYTVEERENSCTNFFNSSLSCHQLKPPETTAS